MQATQTFTDLCPSCLLPVLIGSDGEGNQWYIPVKRGKAGSKDDICRTCGGSVVVDKEKLLTGSKI